MNLRKTTMSMHKRFILPAEGATFFVRLSSWFIGRYDEGVSCYGPKFKQLVVKAVIKKIDDQREEALVDYPEYLEQHWKKPSYFHENFVTKNMPSSCNELSLEEFVMKDGANAFDKMRTIHSKQTDLIAHGVILDVVSENSENFDTCSRRTKQKGILNAVPLDLESPRNATLLQKLELRTGLRSGKQSFNLLLGGLTSAIYSNLSIMKQGSGGYAQVEDETQFIEGTFLEYCRHVRGLTEVQQPTKGHFFFTTTDKQSVKKYIANKVFFPGHADPMVRVSYVKSKNIFQISQQLVKGSLSQQLLQNPRDPTVDATCLRIMAKNELGSSFPEEFVAKEALSGKVEASRFKKGWLGFSNIREVLVNKHQPFKIKIQPKRGCFGKSTVRLEFTVRKTSIKWTQEGMIKKVVFPSVSQPVHATK